MQNGEVCHYVDGSEARSIVSQLDLSVQLGCHYMHMGLEVLKSSWISSWQNIIDGVNEICFDD